MGKPILCLDFDGVLHSYVSGWRGAAIIADKPVPGAAAFLVEATCHFDVQVFSSRSHQEGGIKAMQTWIEIIVLEHFDDGGERPPKYSQVSEVLNAIKWPTEKPPAMVTLDDRAITFTGVWPAIEDLKNFKPWNKQ